VLDVCREESIEVFLEESELEKYSMNAPDGVTVVNSLDDCGAEVCFALGGDGTILRAFNRFRDMQTPVFGVNYGRVGFLSAVEPALLEEGVRSVLRGDYVIFDLSLIELDLQGESYLALNDIVAHKPDGGSIIRLGYSIGGVDMDSISCDGLVISTAAGSTAYNLATGGPLMSLRLDAMVVTAIAPHTLCARPMVAAPGDEVIIRNESISSISSIYVDGRSCGDLAPGSSVTASLSQKKAKLVQLEGANFYQKLHEKFIKPSGS
jgi:NAD+ kinase